MSRVKSSEETVFLFFFSEIFRFLSENFSDFRPKNVKNLSKQPYACPEDQFVAWNFFLKFWTVLDFLQKPLSWFSNIYLRVQSKNCGGNSFLIFLFRFFFGFRAKQNSDFGPKIFKKLSKLTSVWADEQFLAWNFLQKFWTFLDFLHKPLAWFSKFYLRVQSKNCWRNSFLIFLFRIFSDFERKIFQTFGRETSRICQNYLLRVQRNNLWLEFFLSFESFPIFCRNHWHRSQNSIYESRLKNAEKNCFFCFLPRIFSIFERKIFRLLAKSSKSCENDLLRVHRNNLWLQNFLKSFEPFWIFCRNLWLGSQISIYMSRVKIAEEIVFLFFFSEFFRILSENFSRLSAKKLQKVVKTTFYVSRGTVCGLKFFSKVLNRFGFSAQTFGMVLKNLSTCPELKLPKKQFFYFSFQNFFGFWAKTFSDFCPKNVKNSSKLPFTCPEEQFVAWIFLSFESFPIFCRNHWHGSQNSIYESRLKIAEKNCFFFVFLPEFFFDFWAKIFQTFGQIFKKFWKPPSACPEEQFVAWIFFKKFWIVLDFLQKPLAWFSNVYLRVQSKNCGRNSFLNFLFRIFSDFERKFFQTFVEKSSKSCQNHLLRVQRNNLWLEIFF